MSYGLHNTCRSKTYGNNIKDGEMEVYKSEGLKFMCSDLLLFKGRR